MYLGDLLIQTSVDPYVFVMHLWIIHVMKRYVLTIPVPQNIAIFIVSLIVVASVILNNLFYPVHRTLARYCTALCNHNV